jgi:GNAT superfamily N-acetyltransferase
MDAILANRFSNQLLRALEDNMAAFWKVYGRGTGGTLHDSADLMYFISGSPVPLFNGMMSARMPGERADEVIEETRQACIQHQVSAMWWVGPEALPKDLGGRLEGHGFEPAGAVPGMAADLESLRDAGRLADGAAVESVTDQELIQAWAATGWVASGFPAEEAGLFCEIEAQIGIDESRLRRRYAGYWNGKLVGTSVLVLDSGVAGIYAVSTLPEARGHGLGTELTLAPLREAREAGYRVGTLQASEMGYPIYHKIGFQEVCQFNIYLWERR